MTDSNRTEDNRAISNTAETVPLVENEDYYLEHGLFVLTERYHLRRGYCCNQGCRHCPYSEKENPEREIRLNDK